jgi:hypothetical protein
MTRGRQKSHHPRSHDFSFSFFDAVFLICTWHGYTHYIHSELGEAFRRCTAAWPADVFKSAWKERNTRRPLSEHHHRRRGWFIRKSTTSKTAATMPSSRISGPDGRSRQRKSWWFSVGTVPGRACPWWMAENTQIERWTLNFSVNGRPSPV